MAVKAFGPLVLIEFVQLIALRRLFPERDAIQFALGNFAILEFDPGFSPADSMCQIFGAKRYGSFANTVLF